MSENIKKCWYKEMAVYQIWPRSFCDGNGDGVGDLKGILSKLDYIKSLGVDAIWFSPLYESPGKDHGYDISDYRKIASYFGTNDDFKAVLDGAHERGLKVIMDLVINHTSDQHEWFKQSKNPDSPYRDYYFWRKGRCGNKLPPNDWQSNFSGSAWEFDEEADAWYLHLFAKEQPDLNHDNPKVRQEVKDIMKFWLDMGVDGFREDVITYISKDEGLPDGLPIPIIGGMEHYMDGPHLHDYLAEFKHDVLDNYDTVTIGEAPMMTTKKALKHITEGPEQVLNMMFSFQHMEADCFLNSWLHTPFNLKKLKKIYNDWQTSLYGKAWNANYLENHDQPRVISRYGNEKFRVESGKMLATMYICLCGTPFIFQGQEIGMTNISLPSIDMYEDVSTVTVYKMVSKILPKDTTMKMARYASRDNARTPVQWSAEKNAGFTTADKPWFHINPNYTEINVEAAEKDPDSILHYYRKLLKFRKENEIVIYGQYNEHFRNRKDLYVYSRHYKDQRMLVICSFSENEMLFTAPDGFNLSEGELAMCTYNNATTNGNKCVLKPYEARVYLFK